MHLARIVGFSSVVALVSSIAPVAVALAGPTMGVHTRSASTIAHDYGREGQNSYWISHARPGVVPTAQQASAGSVAVGAAPPIQQDPLGWYGRAGGYAGSVRVERIGEPGHSADAGTSALLAEPENGHGRAGGPL